MDECDRLGDKPHLFPDGKIAALEDSNLSDWQKESEIPSSSMLLLSSVNRYLEMEGLGLEEDQEDHQMGEELQDGAYEDMENLEGEEELETSQVGFQEEHMVDLNKTDPLNNSMAKERPRRIHVPGHWKDYPLVLDGAIADSIIHCQLSSLKLKKLTKAIKDIITTRARLCRVLGERCLPTGLQRLITPTTTYSRLLNDLEQINKPSNAPPLSAMKRAKFSHDFSGNQGHSLSLSFPTPMELKKAFNSRIGNKKVQIPLHWNDYPKIVMGAIDASMELCKDRILKSQIRPAVIDVIVNRKKVLHCKNEYQVAHTSLRRYVYYACNFLLRCLGSHGVNLAIQPYINSLTTYKQVQRLFSNKGVPSSSNHSQSADLDEFEDDADDDDDLDDLVSEEPSAADGICLALQGSLQSANMLTQQPTSSYSTPFRPANAWEQMEQDEVVEFKPLMLSPSKTLLNRPTVRIAEEDLIEQNSVSSATSSGLRLPSLAKKLPKVYDSSNMDYFNWDNPDVVEYLQRLKNKEIKVRDVANYFKERYNKMCAQKTIYRHLPRDVSIDDPYLNNRSVGTETLGKSRQIQDLIRAGRFIDGVATIESNFPDFMQDQRELGLFLKIQKLVEQILKLKKLNAEETVTTDVKENGDSSNPTTSTFLQTIDQGLAENVSKKISNEEGLSMCSTGNQKSNIKDDKSLEAVQKCELLSEMGQIAKTIASLLVDGKNNGVIAASSLKEASRRVNDAFAVILDNQSNCAVPENAAYLMANSQWEKLADFFNMALFAHTKLQLTLDLFKD